VTAPTQTPAPNTPATPPPTPAQEAPEPGSGAAPPPTGKPKLTLTTKSTVRIAQPGQQITYLITVRNSGTGTAVNVTVCVRPSPRVVYVAAQGARFQNGHACWTMRALEPGRSKTFRVTVRLDSTAPPGKMSHVASARARNVKGAVLGKAVVGVSKSRGTSAKERSGGVTG
jgi:uncharacterized repeat protein (TIGR01451 family)